MGMEIRLAGPEDAAAVCAVVRRSILECCEADHHGQPEMLEAWLRNKTPDQVANWFTVPSNHSLVAVRDGAIIGFALLTQAGKLSLLYVAPEALGSGAGKALLAAAEAQARHWGIGTLRLHATHDARPFFTHHGYISAGRDNACFGLECELFWKKLDAEPAVTTARKRFCSCNS